MACAIRSHRHDGLAYTLVEPDREPVGGVVILHGAGSCKESHLDHRSVQHDGALQTAALLFLLERCARG